MGHRAGLNVRKISPPPGFDPGPSSPHLSVKYQFLMRREQFDFSTFLKDNIKNVCVAIYNHNFLILLYLALK